MTGGLGNQLFKTMAALNISQILGAELKIDISWFTHFRDHSGRVQSRKFELDYFPRLRTIDTVHNNSARFQRRYRQLVRRLPSPAVTYIGYCTDKNVVESLERRNIRTLDGNFEQINLLPSNIELKKWLAFPESKSKWFIQEAENLGDDFVAVHVRMGDYENLSEIYGFMTPNYYVQAVEKLTSISDCRKLVLFSDDTSTALAWLRNRISFDYIVEPKFGVDSGEVLRLMSMGTGVIMAHSTFSWWAAKFASLREENSVVIMPSRFLMHEENVSARLGYPNWNMIEV